MPRTASVSQTIASHSSEDRIGYKQIVQGFKSFEVSKYACTTLAVGQFVPLHGEKWTVHVSIAFVLLWVLAGELKRGRPALQLHQILGILHRTFVNGNVQTKNGLMQTQDCNVSPSAKATKI